jgi:hypothetical protein
MAIILALVLLTISVITAVPRFPHPIIPTRTAEFALVPKTVVGFKMVKAEIAAEEVIKFLRFIGFIIIRKLDIELKFTNKR